MKRLRRGFTLIEMIIAIVVLGVGLVGVMSAFSLATRGSGDTAARKQMLALAEELMEEVQLKPYAVSGTPPGPTCTRSSFDDVSDYAGYGAGCAITTVEGTAVPALAGYSMLIQVSAASLGSVAAKRIDVTVSRNGESITLTGWRTDYAS